VYEEKDDSNWVIIGRCIYGDVAGDRFRSSVSLSADGKILAIGAWFNDGNGEDSGQVIVYERTYDASSWKQRGQIIYGEVAGDTSRKSISLSLQMEER